MKRWIVVVIGLCLMHTSYVFADEDVKISLNGGLVSNQEYAPFIDENGRTMISIRWVADELQFDTDWNETTKTATVQNGTDVIKLELNSHKISKNNTTIEMDTIPVLKNNRLFVPLKYVSQCLGFDVMWNKKENTAYVIQPERILWKNENYGFLTPKGHNQSEYQIEEKKFDTRTVISIKDAKSKGILFSITDFALQDWERDIKQNISIPYEVLYQDDKNALVCLSVTDVQYDPQNKEQAEQYEKLLATKKQICDSLFVLKK